MVENRETFLRLIDENREDMSYRFVYAIWLAENGYPLSESQAWEWVAERGLNPVSYGPNWGWGIPRYVCMNLLAKIRRRDRRVWINAILDLVDAKAVDIREENGVGVS